MHDDNTLDAVHTLFWHIANRPDAIAFEDDASGEQMTFAMLYTKAQRYAQALRQVFDVQPGQRVLCRMQTSFDMIVSLLGHYLVGAIHVPVNTRYGAVELEHILEDSACDVVVIDDEQGAQILDTLLALPCASSVRGVVSHNKAELKSDASLSLIRHTFESCVDDGAQWSADVLPCWEDICGDDEKIAMILYTSGTTGKSKGVMLSFRSVVSGIKALTDHWRFSTSDRLVLALPLFHVHGLGIGVHGTLIQGCTSLLQARFKPEAVVQAMHAWGGTIFMGVPTMYVRLINHMESTPGVGAKMSSARLYTSGSAALSADLFARFERATGHRILERYGMSETLLTISNPYDPEKRKPGTIGFPIASCEARIVDEQGNPCERGGGPGEIHVRGASLMSGYWQNDKATSDAMTEDGWFRTGDAARYDDEGYIVHVGRQSVDILKVGGYKISAREIEEVLQGSPSVEECAVLGKPDEEFGEVIVAAVVPVGGVQGVDNKDEFVSLLMRFLEGQLADFKRPREIVLIEEIPRNALGKTQKHKLKSVFRA